MIKVTKEGIILSETTNEFENDGVLNPAIYQDGQIIHMFYRAVQKGNISSVGYAKFDGPLNLVERKTTPLLKKSTVAGKQGIEDPRIIKIEEKYYLTYCAYDGINALGSLATSTDLIHFEKQGIIVPQIPIEEFVDFIEEDNFHKDRYLEFLDENYDCDNAKIKPLLWDKNVILFPRKINGKFAMLHRVKPDIQLVFFSEFSDLTADFWKKYMAHFADCILLSPQHQHELNYIGGGCPPIETKEGWLIIYHGVEHTEEGNIYSACVALFDLEHPQEEIARLPYALISPETEWEISGYVNNVVFPSGTAIFDDLLYIYYGAADKRIAVASVNLKDLIVELLKYKK
jgi:predicted GH43/DUF377 family glycosyl hydrolase